MSKKQIDETPVENLEEDSVAMATLHPGSRAVKDDPKSKIEYIQHTIGAMHAMRKTDLEKWFHDAMNLVGKEVASLPGAANEKGNKASLNMKASGAVGKGGAAPNDPMVHLYDKNNPLAKILSVKEDVQEMFEGQDLSEEFKEKATTIFEAAVTARALMEVARIEEEYQTRIEEEVQQIAETLEKQVDSYLDYVVEKWMEDNQVAIESTLRNEIMEEFIDGLKGLFTEHYIDVPEEKISVIEQLAAKVEQLENKLDESINENVSLKKVVVEVEKNEAFAEMAEGLTLTQSEKFEALAEGVDFDGNVDAYKRKLSYIKETYFANTVKKSVSNIEEETFEGEESQTIATNPEVAAFVKAISRTAKK